MRLILNTLVLFLATTVLAVPVPNRPNDALTDGTSIDKQVVVDSLHIHHSKHPKHATHDKIELAPRSMFDELQERAFYDELYTQLERRAGGSKDGSKKPHLKIITAVTKLFKGKGKATSPQSKHTLDPTPHGTPHGSPTNNHAGPSNHANAHGKGGNTGRDKPLPPIPGSPRRANSLPPPASPHRGPPPPYSLHVANPGASNSGSSHSGSIRQPQRSASLDSGRSARSSSSNAASSRRNSLSVSSIAGSNHSPHSFSASAPSSPRDNLSPLSSFSHHKRAIKDTLSSIKKHAKKPYDAVRSRVSQATSSSHKPQAYQSKGGKERPASPDHGNVTPYTGHLAAPSSHAGPSNHANAHGNPDHTRMNKPLPPIPGSPRRANSLSSLPSSHRGSPPPYSMHDPHHGASHNGAGGSSPRHQPQRSMSLDSGRSARSSSSNAASSRRNSLSVSSIAGSNHSPHSFSASAPSSPRDSLSSLSSHSHSKRNLEKTD